MFSGGFRTDFNYNDPVGDGELLEYNQRYFYNFDVYHLNSGLDYGFRRGSIIVGMQFSYGQANDQLQVVNLTDPVEFISDSQLPLTGPINNNVQIRYYDIMVYFGFIFNFMKNENL